MSSRGRLRRYLVVTTLGAALLAVAGPAAALAGGPCEARGRGEAPRPRPAGVHGAFAVGDSTLILAAPRLGRLGIDADARGCRAFPDGLRIIRARRAEGRLPHVVLVALGSNGTLVRRDLRRLRTAVGARRVLALATSRNNAAARAAARAHVRADPHRALLIDWKAHSDGRPSWFSGDGLHPSPDPGAVAMARFYASRLAPVVRPASLGAALPPTVAATKDCGTVVRARSRSRVRVVRGAERITCARARRVARRPPLQRIRGWRWADQRPARSPWVEGYGRVVVALTAAADEAEAAPASPTG